MTLFLMRALLALGLFAAIAPIPAAAAILIPVPARDSVPEPVLTGIVVDTAGRPLPNVQVAITALRRGMSTAADGRFLFRGLAPGEYHIDAVLLGYAPGHAVVTLPDADAEVSVRITMRPTAVRLSAVQVTATPTGADALEITRSTTALTGKELERALGASVAQTLSSEPGLAMRYAGPAANAPVIRGLTGERVLVLQDGARSGDLAASSADHAVSVDPLGASQIEVVRGPASLLYGNSALGGVVNVITNDVPSSVPSHIEGFLALQGESGTPGGGGSGALTLPAGGHAAITARANVRRSTDVYQGGRLRLANSYNRTAGGSVGAAAIGSRASGGISYREHRFDYGLPFAPDAGEGGIHIEGARRQVEGRLNVHGGATALVTRLRVQGTAQWYEHDEVEPDGAVGTTFRLRTQTLDGTAYTRLGRLQGAVGASALLRQYEPIGEEALTPPADSRGAGLFLYQELPLVTPADDEHRVPKLEFGGRYDGYRIETRPEAGRFGSAASRDFANVSGSVGIHFPILRDATFALSAARAFRAPTVEELFADAVHAANASYDIGDASLVSEVNQGLDAVLRVQRPRLSGQFAAYLNRIDHYITTFTPRDTVVDGQALPINRYMQADATLVGAEAQAEGEVASHVVIGVMGDVVRGRFRNDAREGVRRGDPLPYMPVARLGGALRFDDGRHSLGVEYRHGFRQDRVATNEMATESYDLVNLSAGLTRIVGGFVHSVTLRVDNALDERYRDATSRIKTFALNPGRNVSAVYRLLF